MAIIYKKIDDVFVNPENPRHNPVIDDISAINELIELDSESMFELVKSINDYGFFEQKAISLITKNNKLVAIDGNRRIASIKCALDPDIIINKKFKKNILQMSLNHIYKDMKIPCIYYDDVKEAIPYVFAEHADGNQTKKWKIIHQYRFMMTYGLENEVPEIFKLYLENFSFEELSSIDYFSTIERVMTNERTNQISKLFDKKIIKLILIKLIKDSNKKGSQTSRSLNTSEQQSKYFEELCREFSNNPSTDEFINKEIQIEKKIGSLRNKSCNTLAFSKLKYTKLDTNHEMTPAIIDISKEVRNLCKKHFDTFPIATTILIRTLFEISLKYWMNKTLPGVYNTIINAKSGKDPELSKLINEIKNQIMSKNSVFNIQLDQDFLSYFDDKDLGLKERMDKLVHAPWRLGTNSELYKIYEDNLVYKVVDFILNN